MSETALNAGDLETKILRQLKENTTGTAGTDRSGAFPTALIFDTMNEIYEEVMNQPNKQVKIRVSELEFMTIADNSLDGDLSIGDTSIVLADSTATLPASGRILVENEFIDYTANDDVNTLTCAATAVLQDHDSGQTTRPCYVLPSNINKEKVQYVNVNGLPYDIVDVAEMLDEYKSNYRNFAIHEGYLIFTENSSIHGATLFFTPILTRMAVIADIPSYIPNNFRVPLIVNGTTGKLMMLDSQRGFERYYRPSEHRGDRGGGLFYRALREFYANYGRQSDIRNKRASGTVYD